MKLLWIDIETTGLDPHKDQILEVAACVAQLENPFVVNHQYHAVLRPPLKPCDVDLAMLGMHHKSGLWADCERSATTLANVEESLLARIDVTLDREQQTTLAGSSVHFDLGFIRRWMPELARYLHYRVYDVSAVKLFARSLGMPKLPRGEAHRAMVDLQESIEHAQRCAEWLTSQGVEQ